MAEGLYILQWNCNSIKSNYTNFKLLIQETSPNIILLNETCLKEKDFININGYYIHRQDRDEGKGGGIATLVRKEIIHKQNQITIKEMPKKCQIQQIQLLEFNLSIINIYCPPDSKLTDTGWNKLAETIKEPKIIMGDINGHHNLWGSEVPQNTNGKIIIKYLEKNKLIVINDGRATRLNRPGQNKSAVDITLVSQDLAMNVSWNVLEDLYGSDHYPTVCMLRTQDKQKITQMKRRNYKNANWEEYHRKITEKIKSKQIQYNELEEIIHEVAETTIPQRKTINTTKKQKCNNWWDEECSRILKARKESIKKFKNNGNLENYIDIKRTIALSKKVFKSKKKQSFKNFCEKLNVNTPTSKIWKTVRNFKTYHSPNEYNQLPRDTLAEEILQKITPCNIMPEFQIQNNNQTQQDISYWEMESILNTKKKDSATGKDEISYLMIKNLPTEAKKIILNKYNECWRTGDIPEHWKNVIIVPILKPGKNPELSENYRAIALTSCLSKILENIIKNRLEQYIESKRLLPKKQIGFRRGKGTLDAITYLTTYIQNGFIKDEITIGVFLDIKSAYDHVDIYKLYSSLLNMEIPIQIANIVLGYLQNRNTWIRDREYILHGPGKTNIGLPQGSPLSPILFNIYTASLHNEIPPDIEIIQYADDIALMTQGKNIQMLIGKINDYLETLQGWFHNQNFTLSTEKSSGIIFRKGYSRQNFIPVIYNQSRITWKKNIKYLGMTITSNLKWNDHIENIANRAQKNMNIIRAISGISWGADPKTLLTIYKGIIRPHLEYGSQVIQSASKEKLYKLDKIQFSALRTITGCMRSTPINALLGECAEWSLEARRKWLTTKYIIKCQSEKENIVIDQLEKMENTVKNRNKYWTNRKLPGLLSAYQMSRPYTKNLEKNDKISCYEISIENQIFPIKTYITNKNKDETTLAKEIYAEIQEKYPNYVKIYTDGSLNKDNGKAGFGIYIPSINYKFSSRVHKFMQICSIEIIAIQKGIKTCMEKEIDRAIILTDSKAAIQKLKRTKYGEQNHIVNTTKNILGEANQKGKKIIIAWIPGHSGIEGNETADKLAKIGSLLNIPININIDKEDIYPEVKKIIQKEYAETWEENNKKIPFYNKIQNKFQNKPWFWWKEFKNRKHLTAVIRMRTSHCATPYYLHKIGKRESPQCECGSPGTLKHILLECPINISHQMDLYRELSREGVPAPISIFTILTNPNEKVIRILLKFLQINKIDI